MKNDPLEQPRQDWAQRLPPCQSLEVRRFPNGEILLVRADGRRLQIFVSSERVDVNDVRPGELIAAVVLVVAGMAVAAAMWWIDLSVDLVLTLGAMIMLAAITVVTLYFVERSVYARARIEDGHLVIPRLGRSRRVPLRQVAGYEAEADHLVARVVTEGTEGDQRHERVELAELPDAEQRAVALAILRAATSQMLQTGRIYPASLACEPSAPSEPPKT